ncbi:MBL fold metallo-hydrolase [Nocardioides sp. zg-DK7169]|uniref:MBL fold metallo-hydrolase n=1 Tax=Nocardioides sp. zg-DK7169 TaxID=2736600 RepID=UPI0015562729|nr:MBL fold metallo-hydrolase [Nocardioides sp. zg-DK7169]NPC98103.1 MBL fold metallo-hydrolase [Nocardioides sp. zg-DK7169]
MRLKPGRPDLQRYAARFDVPASEEPEHGPARPGARPTITFAGVSTLLIDDGETALLTDGYFSRPGLLRVGLGRVAPNPRRIDAALGRLGVNRLAVVAPVHTHIDHALDSAVVAQRTGAVLAGGASAAYVGLGGGLPQDRLHQVEPGRPQSWGAFTLTWVESAHCPPDRFPGAITAPVVPPARATAYRCGEAWSLLVAHARGRTALVQGSAGFVPGALAGHRAEVAYLGVGQLGVQPESYLEDYWTETVRAVGARRVVLTHWDDFFRSLEHPLRALPYAGDDLHVTMAALGRLAAEDGVALHLPTAFRREDPWADLPSD